MAAVILDPRLHKNLENWARTQRDLILETENAIVSLLGEIARLDDLEKRSGGKTERTLARARFALLELVCDLEHDLTGDCTIAGDELEALRTKLHLDEDGHPLPPTEET